MQLAKLSARQMQSVKFEVLLPQNLYCTKATGKIKCTCALVIPVLIS